MLRMLSWEKCEKSFCLNVALLKNLKSAYIPVIIPTPWPCPKVGIYKYTKSLAGNLVGWNWSEGHFQKLLEVQAFMKCLFILIFCSFCCCLTLVVCICLSEYNLHGFQEFFDGCLIIRCLWFGEYQFIFFISHLSRHLYLRRLGSRSTSLFKVHSNCTNSPF